DDPPQVEDGHLVQKELQFGTRGELREKAADRSGGRSEDLRPDGACREGGQPERLYDGAGPEGEVAQKGPSQDEPEGSSPVPEEEDELDEERRKDGPKEKKERNSEVADGFPTANSRDRLLHRGWGRAPQEPPQNLVREDGPVRE